MCVIRIFRKQDLCVTVWSKKENYGWITVVVYWWFMMAFCKLELEIEWYPKGQSISVCRSEYNVFLIIVFRKPRFKESSSEKLGFIYLNIFTLLTFFNICKKTIEEYWVCIVQVHLHIYSILNHWIKRDRFLCGYFVLFHHHVTGILFF